MLLPFAFRKLVSNGLVHVALSQTARSHMTALAVAVQSSTAAAAAAVDPPPAVALICRMIAATSSREQASTTDHPNVIARICLEPIMNDDKANESSGSLEEEETKSTIRTNDDAGVNDVPESVLLYERQLRKAQHERKSSLPLSADDLQVIHVDDHLVVVRKPPGVLTVPGLHSKSCLLDLVHQQYGQNMTDPVKMTVHRLDMDTSGLVVFARTVETANRLHAMFRDRLVDKQYECLIMGHFPWFDDVIGGDSTGGDGNGETNNYDGKLMEIDLPLQRDHEHPPFMRVSTPRSEAAAMQTVDDLKSHGFRTLVKKKPKESKTLLRVMERASLNVGGDDDEEMTMLPYTRLRLEPITGRMHQLRVHCAALGYPIIGDPTYSYLGEAAPVGGLQSIDAKVVTADGTLARSLDRCAINVQEAWIRHHPMNIKPMCLHAAYLSFPYVRAVSFPFYHASSLTFDLLSLFLSLSLSLSLPTDIQSPMNAWSLKIRRVFEFED
jgi:tRNA pseudouridine32 synthase / 23S rRNA pseudouridine746 synthase